MPTLRSHLTYANVTATLALFLALGAGTATAAKMITGGNVKDNSLTGRDVRSLTTRDIRNSSLLAADFRAGQLPRGERGQPGPAGTLGLAVREGPQGHGDCFSSCEGPYSLSREVKCARGERATGGGVKAPALANYNAVVTESRPTFEGSPTPLPGGPQAKPTGWVGAVRFTVTASPAAIPDPEVWVICATP